MKSLAGLLLLATVCTNLAPSLGRATEADVTEFVHQHQITSEFRHVCRQFGAENYEEKIRLATRKVAQCIAPLIDIEEFKNDFKNKSEPKEYAPVILKYIANVTEVVSCVKDEVRGLVQICFDEKQGLVLNTAWEVLYRALQHSCSERFIDYLADQGLSCTFLLAWEHEYCVNRLVDRPNRPSDNYLMYEFNDKECDYIELKLKCAAKILKVCDKPDRYDKIIDDFFQTVRDPIPCPFKNSSTDFEYKPSVFNAD